MRLKAGWTRWLARRAATSASVSPARRARRASEKPIALSERRPDAVGGRPWARTFASVSTIAWICSMNHGSMRQDSRIWAWSTPSRSACATFRMRSWVGTASAARMAFLSSPRPRPGISISSSPVRPVSRPRSAFWKDSAKVRPIAMTSPTDFIEVVSTGSAPGNFSKAKRGILVTT